MSSASGSAPGLAVAVVTVSDTRGEADDRSGALIAERLASAGHRIIDRAWIQDDIPTLRGHIQGLIARDDVDVCITTGGTGITVRDVTPEAIEPLVTKQLPGFGELFRWLSYKDIGSSTIQSRALGALCGGTLVFALPGSTGACRLAMDEILVHQLDLTHKPCNFAELLPRIRGESAPPPRSSAS